MRKELSEAYRITRDFGFDEPVWNHYLHSFPLRRKLLDYPGDRMFDDTSSHSWSKALETSAADIIHDAVYKARDDVKVINSFAYACDGRNFLSRNGVRPPAWQCSGSRSCLWDVVRHPGTEW
jgi:hypothetical protein